MIIKNKENLPQHIVIIPDGNRHWARKRGFSPWRGHIAGAESSKELLQAALDLSIKCVSFWGGSWDNLTKRPKMEIKFLIKIYDQYVKKLAKRKEIHDNKIRINIIGRWRELMPKKVIKSFDNIIELTKDYNERFLNFFIAYNGTDEMLSAINSILKEKKIDNRLEVSSDLLKKHLWSGSLPPVDFLIRTGGAKDPHNSVGFMMWNCANSQLYFAKEFHPDFKKKQFIKAIKDYQNRERRHGK